MGDSGALDKRKGARLVCRCAQGRQNTSGVLSTGLKYEGWKTMSCVRLASGEVWTAVMPVQVPRQLIM